MAVNLIGRDPTRTTLLRKTFTMDFNKRFRKLQKSVKELVVDEDVFGLTKSVPFTFNLTFNQEPQAWRFRTNSDKLTSFNKWFSQQVDQDLLTVTGVTGQPWTSPYVESAYKKGVIRAYTDTHVELGQQAGFFEGSKAEFLNQAFNTPEAVGKLRLLQTRVFEELKGITATMSQQMSRVLATGLSQGLGAEAIARNLNDTIGKINRTRARVLARTEIVHAHAEGQLDAFERLGVERLGVMAEWSTAGDKRVCARCEDLEGETFTIDEARGMIPLHPNCRCAWIPAFGKKKKKKKKVPTGAPTAPIPRAPRAPSKKAIKEARKKVDDAPTLDMDGDPIPPGNPRGVSPENFTMEVPLDDASDLLVNEAYRARRELDKLGKLEMQLVDLNIDELRKTQYLVNKGGVKHYLKPGVYKDPIVVTKLEGEYIIFDGHHRALAEKFLGRKKIQVRLLDLDELKKLELKVPKTLKKIPARAGMTETEALDYSFETSYFERVDEGADLLMKDAKARGIALSENRAKDIAESVIKYTDEGNLEDYTLIRDFVKGRIPKTDPDYLLLKKGVKNLDDFLDISASFPSERKLYRGATFNNELRPERWEKYKSMKVGDILDMDDAGSFTSWSSSEQVASDFTDFTRRADRNVAVFFNLTGTRSGVGISHVSMQPQEMEILIKRGVKIRILEVKKIVGKTDDALHSFEFTVEEVL